MRKLLSIAILLVLTYFGLAGHNVIGPGPVSGTAAPEVTTATSSGIAEAYRDHAANVHVTGTGTVVRVLSDDADGDRHQRFILRLPSGQTLLVAHNIDLSQRVQGLLEGDTVEFNGEYVWNAQGGILHWTHRDPQGRHAAGWLRHNGNTVQ